MATIFFRFSQVGYIIAYISMTLVFLVIYAYETVVGYLEPSYIMCIRKKMVADQKVA